ncbi:hypothetical protein DSO57_1029577 [Entomophthora muscae]|uniref:Uncharacterized protein n=1 Tax=Entomophthora muscae TaxID=34485 RepID=A0ACC2RFU4_9FUNG|nr:hypothetical protein DSO57_1029577 [Entomophthora muscae]
MCRESDLDIFKVPFFSSFSFSFVPFFVLLLSPSLALWCWCLSLPLSLVLPSLCCLCPTHLLITLWLLVVFLPFFFSLSSTLRFFNVFVPFFPLPQYFSLFGLCALFSSIVSLSFLPSCHLLLVLLWPGDFFLLGFCLLFPVVWSLPPLLALLSQCAHQKVP